MDPRSLKIQYDAVQILYKMKLSHIADLTKENQHLKDQLSVLESKSGGISNIQAPAVDISCSNESELANAIANHIVLAKRKEQPGKTSLTIAVSNLDKLSVSELSNQFHMCQSGTAQVYDVRYKSNERTQFIFRRAIKSRFRSLELKKQAKASCLST